MLAHSLNILPSSSPFLISASRMALVPMAFNGTMSLSGDARSLSSTAATHALEQTSIATASSTSFPSAEVPAREKSKPFYEGYNRSSKKDGELLKRLLLVRKVARVSSGGKIRSISALVVVGNQNGSAGYAMGRATDISSAVRKAMVLAEKNMVYIERLDNRTILSDIDHNFNQVNLRLQTVPPGHGLMVNNYIHEVCRCIGISDLGGKVFGSKNPMNVIKATFEALSMQKRPADIARMRGKKVMDVEMAYYGTKI